MGDFTREDEYQLDTLRAARDCGNLSPGEFESLQYLERKYDAFIEDGIRKLERMAPQSARREHMLPFVFISWPALWSLLTLLLVTFYLLTYGQQGILVQTLLRWQVCLAALMLLASTPLTFTRCRDRRFVEVGVLVAFMMFSGVFMLTSLWVIHHLRSLSDSEWDINTCVIVGVANSSLMLLSGLLLMKVLEM
ncbi:hypothetical protein, conserved [Trypanosoma brucei brucei TREU927]|uniref:Uncharacterized protein n=1 Tax=Trypanosoma brucei brucei (strain 927/4 GUTat10.1) TaxID=185431 RepID=Q386J3_TRYB2|nr:hypothetical protein, conserved [Trypanosoma brucei brucei TREU927]EAN79288.1 hypothetical protein, conserved [Trypanosoma brucei brucei TREU927]